jgi:hypothetical protein
MSRVSSPLCVILPPSSFPTYEIKTNRYERSNWYIQDVNAPLLTYYYLPSPSGNSTRPRASGRTVVKPQRSDLSSPTIRLRARLHSPNSRRLGDSRAAGIHLDPHLTSPARFRRRQARGPNLKGHGTVPAEGQTVYRHNDGYAAGGSRGVF